ncbi:MAG: hypothetical protein Q4E10_02525 [Porphyromonas sp.]|nr:hypothetical protein [Porphyromonas sp.]
MNKKIVVALVALMACFGLKANAQNVMHNGANIITVGAGLTDSHVPLSVAFDHGVVDNLFESPNASLSLGGMAGALLGKNYAGFVIGPRVGIHYHFIPQLDTYFSLMLGLTGARYKENVNVGNGEKVKVDSGWSNEFEWGSHIGARYFFTPQVGAFIELGYGYTFANIGIAFKL